MPDPRRRDERGDVRVAVVGYGLGGRTFQAPVLAAVPGLALTSVVTGDASRAAQAREDHPGVTVLPSVDALVAAATEHDVAVVTTTNTSHAPVARRLLDAGVAVVVDKPLAVTAAEARDLVAYAAACGGRLSVVHNRRWDSDQRTLARLVADGTLGEVVRHESRFERWRPTLNAQKWREAAPASEGGGILLDLGTHLVDQAVALFGPVTRVYAEVHARRGGSDDDTFLALTHASGVASHLSATALAGAPGPRRRVLGTGGAYVIDGLDGQEAALRAGRTPAEDGWGEEPPERWGRLVRDDAPGEPVASERGRWDAFWEAVPAWLRGEAPPPVDPADAVHVAEVLEAARRSAAEGTVVPVSAAR